MRCSDTRAGEGPCTNQHVAHGGLATSSGRVSDHRRSHNKDTPRFTPDDLLLPCRGCDKDYDAWGCRRSGPPKDTIGPEATTLTRFRLRFFDALLCSMYNECICNLPGTLPRQAEQANRGDVLILHHFEHDSLVSKEVGLAKGIGDRAPVVNNRLARLPENGLDRCPL